MPILDDIMDHDYLGPMIRRERLAGERTVVMRQIEKRFGPVPASARQRLEGMTLPEVEETALRVLDAESLEDLLGR
jgi:hypothetical protein